MVNMYCLEQKANSKDWYDNYDRIFKRQFFDVVDDIQSIIEEANQMEEKLALHICRLCGELGDEVCTKEEWSMLWNNICDGCAHKIMKEENYEN